MSSAEELLASLEEISPVHDHTISDPDSYFVIDPDTHQISNLSQSPNVLMQNDHNSEVYTFQIPRFVEGHDMLKCDRVRLHYINTAKGSTRTYKDVYEMTDLMVNPRDNSTLISTWTIKRQATQYAGKLSFAIQYICIDESHSGEESDNVSYEWHTDIYKDVEVRETIVNSEEAVSEYTDILEEWYQRLFGTESSLIETVVSAANEQKEAIELKGEEVLGSIPEDYTTTHDMADKALRKKANAIEQSAEGETIFIDDSSDAYLLGLNLYGKTTQVTTTGAQLFDHRNIKSHTYTKIDEDGTIHIECDNTDGTSAKYAPFYTPVSTLLNESTSYALVLEVFESSCVGEDIHLTSEHVSEPTQFVGSATVGVLNVGTHIRIAETRASFADSVYMCRGFMTIPVGKHVKSKIRFSIVANTNVTADTFVYEPYSNGVASPSPAYPQALKSVTNPSTLVSGPNLAYFGDVLKTPKTVNGVTTVLRPDGRIVSTGTPTVTGIIDTIHAAAISGDALIRGARYRTENCSMQVKYTDGTTAWPRDIVVTDDVVSINAYVQPRSDYFGSGLTFEPTMWINDLKPSKFEPGSKVDTLKLNMTLTGVPVSQNGNYTDANGQQWICDEIDFERGVYVKRITRVVCNRLSINAGDSFTKVAPLRGESDVELLGKTTGAMLCPVTKRYEYNRNDAVHMYTEGTAVWVFVPADYDYVNNPPEALAIIKTPIETPLTDEQIALYKRLKTNYHNTIVLNDGSAHMVVKYNTDTKRFFEKNSIASDAQVEAAVTAYLNKYFANAEGVSF